MQVSDIEQKITHVVMGEDDSFEFGISNSPEFYQILSKSLYTNHMLAVVREVICNAWDAHIAAGMTDTPVEVTVNNEEGFVVRDFGSGIPHDKIRSVYCVYGASTKKGDKDSTGGFGLGCKAPFAYTDQFVVKNHNQGKLGIYSISKSSGKTNGMPSCARLLDVETEESGIEVQIEIEKHTDAAEFIRLVQQVAFNGNMLVNLNKSGKSLPRLETSEDNDLQAIISWSNHQRLGSSITVRYGTVVYPIPENKNLNHLLAAVRQFLERYSRLNKYYNPQPCITFLAEPDSLSVAPSREALSMTDSTVEYLANTMSSFLKKVEEFPNHYDWCLNNLKERVRAIKEYAALDLCQKVSIKHLAEIMEDRNDDLTKQCPVQTQKVLFQKLFTLRSFQETLTKEQRYDKMIPLVQDLYGDELKNGNPIIYQAVLREVKNNSDHYRSNIFTKVITRPLQKFLAKEFCEDLPKLTRTMAMVYLPYGSGLKGMNAKVDQHYPGDYQIYQFSNVVPQMDHSSFLLTNIKIVLLHNMVPYRKDQRGNIDPDLRNTPHIAIRVTRTKKNIKQFRDAFAKWKLCPVVDLLEDPEQKDVTVKVATTKRPGYKKLKGWPTLSNLWDESGDISFLGTLHRPTKEVRDAWEVCDQPTAYLKMNYNSSRHYSDRLPGMNVHLSKQILKMIGSQCVLIKTDEQEQKVLSLGAVPLMDLVKESVTTFVNNNRKSFERLCYRGSSNNVYRKQSVECFPAIYALECCKTKAKILGIPYIRPLTSDEEFVLGYLDYYRHRSDSADVAAFGESRMPTLTQEISMKFAKHPLSMYIDFHQILRILTDNEPKDPKFQKALDAFNHLYHGDTP